MTGKPMTITEKLLDLPVGKSAVVSRSPGAIIRTLRKHRPDQRYSQRKVADQYVITRTA